MVYEIIVTLVAGLSIAGWMEDHHYLTRKIRAKEHECGLLRKAAMAAFEEARKRKSSFFAT